ncbi:hypothetical protein F4778DRAFT_786275 [Xylariomycetidae sp. FL2044]|nr:hypothetical protein F4778DRAFT_786275 [Xylariomycetidae sp. FL2044]
MALPPPTASWQDRAREKRSRILAQVPKHFIHPSLSFSDVEAVDVLDIPVFSTTTNPSRVMDVPEQFLTPQDLAITALKAEEIPPAIGRGPLPWIHIMYAAASARANGGLDEEFAADGAVAGARLHVRTAVREGPSAGSRGDGDRPVATSHIWGTFDNKASLLVHILQDAGAVPFAKTTLCGGSSGGEGALIGFRGSPLGVGSDLAAWEVLLELLPGTRAFMDSGRLPVAFPTTAS